MKLQKFFLLLSLLSFVSLGLCGCVADGPEPEAMKDPNVKQLPAEAKPVVWEESEADKKLIFYVKLETSKGDVVVEVHPAWSPKGAAQFKAAVEDGVYDNAKFFRVLSGFMAQFGIAGDPAKAAKWERMNIADEPVKMSNTRGMVTYAKGGPNSRTTQLFINYGNNSRLDEDGFPPFAKVVQGMEVVDSFYNEYGEGAPEGRGPSQGRIQSEGNKYLEASFPNLDFIKKATVLSSPPQLNSEAAAPAGNPAPEANAQPAPNAPAGN